jgi:antitoxin component YwqK of YwqJK toxin-antitoxin module
VNGDIHGVGKLYYESGALWEETPYVNGIRQGIEKHYDKDNLNIEYIKLYKRDHEVLVLRLESYGNASTKSYI